MKVRISDRARRELRRAVTYLAERSPQAARRFRADIGQATASLAEFPLRGQVVGPGELRRLIRGRYIIFYEVVGREVLVARIVHGSRDLAAELETPPDDG